MTAKVAVASDVTATASSVLPPVAAGGSGTWTAGSISCASYGKLTVGQAVVWKAECTFSFSGANSGGTAVTDQETVTLTAGTTKLQRQQHGVLRDGDAATGLKGNKLSVSVSHAGRTLASA